MGLPASVFLWTSLLSLTLAGAEVVGTLNSMSVQSVMVHNLLDVFVHKYKKSMMTLLK